MPPSPPAKKTVEGMCSADQAAGEGSPCACQFLAVKTSFFFGSVKNGCVCDRVSVTSKCCCAFSRIRLFSPLSCWFSSCSLMMLFFAMASCRHKTCRELSAVSVMLWLRLWFQTFCFGKAFIECWFFTSSMSLELDFSRESTLPWRPWTVELHAENKT